jgi:hypothetical protein
MTVFEFALLHVLGRQLRQATERGPAEPPAIRSITALRPDVEVILSAAAWAGAATEAEARVAFGAGADALQAGPGSTGGMGLRPRADVDLQAVDAAFSRTRAALPAIRHRIMEAAALVAAHDGQVLVQEAEMLRAVAEAIDCPMPPVIARS